MDTFLGLFKGKDPVVKAEEELAEAQKRLDEARAEAAKTSPPADGTAAQLGQGRRKHKKTRKGRKGSKRARTGRRSTRL